MGVAFAVGTVVINPLLLTLNVWFRRDFSRELAVWQAARKADYRWPGFKEQVHWISSFERNAPIVLAVGAALLVLYFAARNFRSFDRNRRVILKQALVFTLYCACATIVYSLDF
jgi:hypothetical protein